MDRETVHVIVFAICKLLGQQKDDRTIEKAVNEGIEEYQKRLPPARA
jgi:hypothetical protein